MFVQYASGITPPVVGYLCMGLFSIFLCLARKPQRQWSLHDPAFA